MVGTKYRSGHLPERAVGDSIKEGQAIFRLFLRSALTISLRWGVTIQVDLQVFVDHLFKPFSL